MILATLVVLLVLRELPAAALGWLPPCPFHQWTGLLCPGCGSTRALLSLLHGDLRLAWLTNPLFLLLLPGTVSYGMPAARRRQLPALPRLAIALFLLAVLAFGVARNLPLG